MSAIVGAAPPLPINPDDWSYLAEGGFHIILRYDGTDPELTGRILRIGKKALGHQKEAAAADPAKPAAVVPDEAGARRKFERGVLMPLLGEQYVQPGDAVTLSREDIGKIHLRCVEELHNCSSNKRAGMATTTQQQHPPLHAVRTAGMG